MRDEKKRSRMYASGCCPLEEQHRSERGSVSHRWDWAISGAWRRSQRAAGVGRLATTAATDSQALPTIRVGTRPSLWAGYSSLKVIVNELSRFPGYITFNLYIFPVRSIDEVILAKWD
jgi:hypothetical protein